MASSAVPILLLLLFLVYTAIAAAADNTKPEPCKNPIQLIKVKNWVDGTEGKMYNGMTATFGSLLPEKADQTVRNPAVISDPVDCCSPSKSKSSGSVAICMRGTCDFAVKASVAQSGGATAVLMINESEELFQMVCTNDAGANISIPAVMIAKSTGEALSKSLTSRRRVEILLYAPTRPVIDYSVGFLWLMSVGTVICASLWSDITSTDRSGEHYNGFSPKASSNAEKDNSEEEIVNVDTKGAIVFVITASAFLVLLFFFMSSWLIWVLIVLFCIGGVQVM